MCHKVSSVRDVHSLPTNYSLIEAQNMYKELRNDYNILKSEVSSKSLSGKKSYRRNYSVKKFTPKKKKSEVKNTLVAKRSKTNRLVKPQPESLEKEKPVSGLLPDLKIRIAGVEEQIPEPERVHIEIKPWNSDENIKIRKVSSFVTICVEEGSKKA